MNLRMKQYTVTSAAWHLLRPSGTFFFSSVPLPHIDVSSMRIAAGPSVKSALSHTYVLDTRDDRFMATRGFYFRFHQELAGAGISIPVSEATPDTPAATTRLGLGGDASFYKAETEAQISRPISHGIVSFSFLKFDAFPEFSQSLSLGLRSGILLGLQGKPTLFSDRFQLGGPTSVRAFKAFGMGPRDGRKYRIISCPH